MSGSIGIAADQVISKSDTCDSESVPVDHPMMGKTLACNLDFKERRLCVEKA